MKAIEHEHFTVYVIEDSDPDNHPLRFHSKNKRDSFNSGIAIGSVRFDHSDQRETKMQHLDSEFQQRLDDARNSYLSRLTKGTYQPPARTDEEAQQRLDQARQAYLDGMTGKR
uniref:Uncharacterized protein n=1 Tax=Cyanothece sp. (strain PCC 7425 / ATCC 29141) TaxID=395961 RepID=B8HYH5_CYAP4